MNPPRFDQHFHVLSVVVDSGRNRRVTEKCRSSTTAKILLSLGLLLFLLLQLLLLLLPLHRKKNPKALSMTPFGDIKFHFGVS